MTSSLRQILLHSQQSRQPQLLDLLLRKLKPHIAVAIAITREDAPLREAVPAASVILWLREYRNGEPQDIQTRLVREVVSEQYRGCAELRQRANRENLPDSDPDQPAKSRELDRCLALCKEQYIPEMLQILADRKLHQAQSPSVELSLAFQSGRVVGIRLSRDEGLNR